MYIHTFSSIHTFFCIQTVQSLFRMWVQRDQLKMSVLFLYLEKSDLYSVRYCARVPKTWLIARQLVRSPIQWNVGACARIHLTTQILTHKKRKNRREREMERFYTRGGFKEGAASCPPPSTLRVGPGEGPLIFSYIISKIASKQVWHT